MRLKILLLPVLIASGATATGICGTHGPTQEQMQIARNLQLREINARSMGGSLANKAGININVYYHVIADSTSKDAGFLAPSDLERQTRALNERYRPHNISWTQAGVDWWIAPQWSENQDERTMQRFLRKGTYTDMNVYIFPSIKYLNGEYIGMWTVIGYCSEFPKIVTLQSDDWYHDAILIRSDTTPGSATR